MTTTVDDLTRASRSQQTLWRLPLVFTLASREMRSGLSGFGVLIACIALGVAVITGVGALADAVLSGFAREGRVLLGGDVTLRRVHARITADERAKLNRLGTVSETATVRTMARTLDGGDQTLAEIKAVDDLYPLLGTFVLSSGRNLNETVRESRGIVVAQSLLDRLGVRVGDRLNVGGTPLVISDVIVDEPDKISARLAFGPRVVMSLKTLDAIGLVKPGTLINWQYSVVTPDGSLGDNADVVAARKTIADELGVAGFTVQDRRDPSPRVTTTLNRLRQFLTLLGLTALLVGGVGVANAVATFIDRRRSVIAAYKSLGASRAQVFWIFLTQVLMLSSIGVAIGLVLGLATPLLAAWSFSGALPFALEPEIGLSTVGMGIAYGFLVALLFVIWPLGQAERIRPAALFRNEVASKWQLPSSRARFMIAGVAAALTAFTVLASGIPQTAIAFIVGAAAILSLFWALGLGVEAVARRVPRPTRPALALAMMGMAAPGGLTRSVVLSLGAGLSLLVMVALVDRSLTAELGGRLPENSPDYFAIDIPKGDLGTFKSAIINSAPGSVIETAPMLRGRIVALNGVPAASVPLENERARLLLNGDRGLSYSAELPRGSVLAEGAWWSKTYDGPPLVSFVADFAERFGLKVGDTVTVNVLGRNITARIANLRDVEWESLAINFSMVFPPSVLAAAPHNLLATVRFAPGSGVSAQADAARAVSQQLPAITLINVRDALAAFASIFERVMIAVRAAGSLTLLAGALVLAGALATAQRRRIMQAVILKCLGATRRRLLLAHVFEYGILAVIAALLSVGVGTIAAWIITTFSLEIGFTMSWTAVVYALAGAIGLVLAVGSVGTWRILSARPVPHLRGF
ncbi:MAG: FtsX-like permease family protein [Pseudomonadota bacterium]